MPLSSVDEWCSCDMICSDRFPLSFRLPLSAELLMTDMPNHSLNLRRISLDLVIQESPKIAYSNQSPRARQSYMKRSLPWSELVDVLLWTDIVYGWICTSLLTQCLQAEPGLVCSPKTVSLLSSFPSLTGLSSQSFNIASASN